MSKNPVQERGFKRISTNNHFFSQSKQILLHVFSTVKPWFYFNFNFEVVGKEAISVKQYHQILLYLLLVLICLKFRIRVIDAYTAQVCQTSYFNLYAFRFVWQEKHNLILKNSQNHERRITKKWAVVIWCPQIIIFYSLLTLFHKL